MQTDFTLNAAQWGALQKTLKDLELPPAKRRRLLWRILKSGVMPAARRHQKRQENAEGVKWPGRADKRKAKMMTKLPGMMVIGELPASDSARIYLRGNKKTPPGVVGRMQQVGFTTSMTAQKAAKGQDSTANATLNQAKKLLDLGYVVFPVSAPRAPSVAEIMRTLSQRKAGAIIRSLEGKASKRSWTITLPGREWLAVNDDEFNKMLARQMQAINYGGGVRAQDIKGKVKK
ncbi:phage-like protein [Yersinia aldovae]|uniref:hypothetical protein n=1 Tax=Yersinia aldovae TaxID=29483 RepID=UPI0005E964CA|nr:hypothetical protein [Yersinia aldovae]CNK19833.1 phage-like protein [Yersinia aldovae]